MTDQFNPGLTAQPTSCFLAAAARPPINGYRMSSAGSQLFISGQLPIENEATRGQGPCSAVDVACFSGRTKGRPSLCAINILAQTNAALGGESRAHRASGQAQWIVASEPSFTDQPSGDHGGSNLIAELLGEPRQACPCRRCMACLPAQCGSRIDAIIEIGKNQQ